jgi:hypothetical protein
MPVLKPPQKMMPPKKPITSKASTDHLAEGRRSARHVLRTNPGLLALMMQSFDDQWNA